MKTYIRVAVLCCLISLLSASDPVSRAGGIPKFVKDAIKEYRKVSSTEYIQYLQAGGNEPRSLTETHIVLKKHIVEVRQNRPKANQKDIWTPIFNGLIDKKYFEGVGRKGLRAARNAFYRLLCGKMDLEERWHNRNVPEFQETIKQMLGAYCESEDISRLERLYVLIAFVLVYCKDEKSQNHKPCSTLKHKARPDFLPAPATDLLFDEIDYNCEDNKKSSFFKPNRLLTALPNLHHVDYSYPPRFAGVNFNSQVHFQNESYLDQSESTEMQIQDNFFQYSDYSHDADDKDFYYLEAINAAESTEGHNIDSFPFVEIAFPSAMNVDHA